MKNLYKKLLSVLVLLVALQTQAQVITSVSPNSGNISETIDVTISGAGFSFGQGTGTIQATLADSLSSFSNSVTAEQIQVINSNTIIATFTLNYSSIIGLHDLYVIDSQGNYALEPSAFTINPATTAFTLTSVTPNTAHAGQVISVSISGQGASFGQGTSTTEVLLLNGTNTISADGITVVNSNNIDAQFTLNNTSALGIYTLYVFNSIDGAVLLPTAFNITPNPNAPSLTTITPSNAMAGNTISVNISGQNTNFGQGTATTQVWFNQGSSTLYSSSVNVTSTTSLTANITIPNGVSLGQYNTNVSNNVDGDLSLANSFTVDANPNGPMITSVTPNSGGIGESISVTISGQNTHFTQGTGTVMFTQGTSTLSANITSVISDTLISADVYVPYYASLGAYQLTTNFTADGAIVLDNAFNVVQSCNIYVYVNPQACGSSYADVYISGGTAPYNLLINGQSYISYSNYYTFTPPAPGTYQITNVTDINGCTSTFQNTMVTFNDFSGSFTGNFNTCLGSPIVITDNIVSQSPVTEIFYDFGDGSYGNTPAHIYLYPGTYTVSATAYNADGCSLFLQGVTVTIDSLPTITASNIIPSTCSLNNGGFTILSTGTSYSVTNSQTGYSSTAAVQSNLAPGTYMATVYNASGCSNTTSVNIISTTLSTNISGTITSQALLAAGNAQVELLALNDAVGAMNTVATTTTDATGVYSFSNLNEGSYLLSVTPDTSVNPGALATYFNNQALWNFADTIQVTCVAGLQTIDMVLLNIDTANGNATVSGNVSSSSFNRSVIGDAIVGANVLLHNDVANTFSNIVQTDVNGDYEFTGIAPGTYSVLVDLGGLDLIAAYTFTIQANQTFNNYNFYVDTIAQTIDTIAPNVTSINQVNNVIAKAVVYPNPFIGSARLVYNISNTTMVTIEMFDVLGNKVSTIENGYKDKGTYASTILAPSNGIYFVKIIANNKQQILKVISKN